MASGIYKRSASYIRNVLKKHLATPRKAIGTNQPFIGSRISYQAFVVCHKAGLGREFAARFHKRWWYLDANLLLLVTKLGLGDV